jgi:hypothetical protein
MRASKSSCIPGQPFGTLLHKGSTLVAALYTPNNAEFRSVLADGTPARATSQRKKKGVPYSYAFWSTAPNSTAFQSTAKQRLRDRVRLNRLPPFPRPPVGTDGPVHGPASGRRFNTPLW